MQPASPRWQPSAQLSTLRQRASIIATIRRFFDTRGHLEVTTPLMAADTNSDTHVDSIPLTCMGQRKWLQTSPEQHMKRLLAAGIGACYQIGPAFRSDELGKQHNPEFTLLEWYTPGHSLNELINECTDLIGTLAPQAARNLTCSNYTQLWCKFLPGNPHTLSTEVADSILTPSERATLGHLAVDQMIDYLFSSRIQPQLHQPVFVHSFPASTSAMATMSQEKHGNTAPYNVSDRVELYWQGLEILNGYNELLDASELQQRYRADSRARASRKLAAVPPQTKLYAAMEHGIPACAGAALGIERLLMCLLERTNITEVMAFAYDEA